MTPKRFTEEQIRVLRKNPNTTYVSDSVIKFTQEFKVKLVEAVEQGVPARRFIQEAGYDYEMLGDDRIKTFIALAEGGENREYTRRIQRTEASP